MKVDSASKTPRPATGLSCDFCGAHEQDVGKLIAGDVASICDRCVVKAIEVVFHCACAPAPGVKRRQFGEAVCSFCHAFARETSLLVRSRTASVCDRCLCGIVKAVAQDLRAGSGRAPVLDLWMHTGSTPS